MMTDKEISATKILLEVHLQLWGESDPVARMALLKQIYSENIRVTDPGIVLNGYEEVDQFIDNLLKDNPDFVFTTVKPSEIHHQSAIMYWQFGPSCGPKQVTGQDIFTLHDGRVLTLLIFIDGITAATHVKESR